MPGSKVTRFLVLLMSLVLLSACGGSQPPSAAKTTPAAPPKTAEATKAAPAPAEKITLRAADSLPLTHIFSKGFVKWMNRVTELTAGQVQFQHFPAEQLGKRKDLFELTKNGTADVGYVLPVDMPNQLPRSTVVELPGFTSKSECGSQVLLKLMQEYADQEYLPNGMRPLLAHYVAGYDLFTNKELKSPADVKGMKIRSGGGLQDFTVKELGAVPVTLASPEVYEAVQRKTIDGVLFPYTGVKPYKIQEVTKYATNGAALGSAALTYVINESKWQKLPQNARDAMTKAAQEVIPATSKEEDKSLADLAAELKAAKMNIVDLTKEQQAAWKQAVSGVQKSWLESAGKAGVKNGQEVIARRDKIAAGLGC